MRIPIVNENDEIIGVKDSDDLAVSDIYRVSAIWITNSDGEILLAQRAFTKKKDPGKWGAAVAGTVEEGESYLDNILKEADEELGLTLSPNDLIPGPKVRITAPNANYFSQWYLYSLDKPTEAFRLQKEEVETVKWFTSEELKHKLTEHLELFTPSAPHWISSFLK
jgi:isopentenyl-diphosphate Delta-isomerase